MGTERIRKLIGVLKSNLPDDDHSVFCENKICCPTIGCRECPVENSRSMQELINELKDAVVLMEK